MAHLQISGYSSLLTALTLSRPNIIALTGAKAQKYQALFCSSLVKAVKRNSECGKTTKIVAFSTVFYKIIAYHGANRVILTLCHVTPAAQAPVMRPISATSQGQV